MNHEEKPLEIKAMNKTQLAAYFGISLHVLNKWLQPFWPKIGVVTSEIFTPKQVRIIIECLG
jgi:hypothetical protein